jgi:hypothetical protein
MPSLLLASFKTKREANRISRLILEHSKPTRSIIGSNLEDMYLAEMIEEGMKEKGEVRIADFKKYLTKRIVKLSR